ncbi:MAG: hypothetical protein HGN29_17870 [Asgard group archaeon]|nr:hypothetical protein [Asgard group archaeon]
MKLEFPLTPEKIREGMEKVISTIREETKWDLQRTLADVTIEIGEAPEQGYVFGVKRTKKKLQFATWIENVQPEITGKKIWEFIVIRESMSLFVSEDILGDQISELTNLFLNFMAMAYHQKMHEGKSFESEFQLLKARFLYLTEAEKVITKEMETELDSLLTIIVTQGVTYELIYKTYLFFIEDIPKSEIDAEELVSDFNRYLASSPEDIAAPVQFKDAVVIVINELINLGHNTSAVEIAKNLQMNHATVTRHLTKLVSRYNAYWRREYNWKKMGLHTYLLLIKFSKDGTIHREEISKLLENIPYIYQLSEGENSEHIYLYTVFHCPHSTADNLSYSLEKKQNEKIINSFEIKPIQRRVYRTAFVHPKIKPTLNNYEKMISGRSPLQKFEVWDNSVFDSKAIELDNSNENLLGFMSILLNKSITTKGYFGVWLDKLEDFLLGNNINPKDTLEGTSFFNELQKKAIEKQLLDFRLTISPSRMRSVERLIIRVKCKPDSDTTFRLIEELSIFGWMVILYSYDEIFLLINGLNFKDKLTELLATILEEKDLDFEFLSIKDKLIRHIPLNELFDYKNKRWKL